MEINTNQMSRLNTNPDINFFRTDPGFQSLSLTAYSGRRKSPCQPKSVNGYRLRRWFFWNKKSKAGFGFLTDF